MTKRAVDFYSFEATKGKRVVVDCAAAGIDSKLTPCSSSPMRRGAICSVNRTGGVLDFTPPADGRYLIKVHDLTFQGGPEHFYRLALLDAPGTGPDAAPAGDGHGELHSRGRPEASAKLPQTRGDGAEQPARRSAEDHAAVRRSRAASFPAADVDTFEFTAKKGEVWWIEVASERLGLADRSVRPRAARHDGRRRGEAHGRRGTQRHRPAR